MSGNPTNQGLSKKRNAIRSTASMIRLKPQLTHSQHSQHSQQSRRES